MNFKHQTVYHQQFENGDRVYFLAIEQCENGRWKGFRTSGNRKPVKTIGDPTIPGWIETPQRQIPRKLKDPNVDHQ